ncbi:MAG: glycosyltransferase family 39 protein [candidate division KSB1 bacterium]|nr:glycosyltransferase family 39 protein [candidate division KSB1 bacterium]
MKRTKPFMTRTTESPTNRFAFAVLLLILLGAAAVRLINLGVPSLWVDEVNHVYAGQSLMNGEEPRFPSGNLNERALLYSWTVAISFKLFGVNEFAARLPSVAFGLLAIVVVFFFARSLFNTRIALLSAFLLAFSHNAIGWSRTSRMYTLFQLLFLLGVWLFWRGFERRQDVAEASAWYRILDVDLRWIVASLGVFALSFHVHQLTALFAPSLWAYSAVLFVIAGVQRGWGEAVRSRYGFVSLGAVLLGLLALTLLGLKEFLEYAIHFRPAWARYNLVTDTHYYFWFLAKSSNFPIAALFLIGALQTVTRLDKHAFFALCNFAVPAFMLSFVFSYRVHNYIFHVYPFYVMLAAYALDNLFEAEYGILKEKLRGAVFRLSDRWLRWLAYAIIVGWLPLTVWFRYALKLPYVVPTGMNGAVDHLNWRAAVDWLRENGAADGVIVSTLPLTIHYYLGHVEYNLNMANLDETLDWRNGEARVDYYSGVPAITSVEELKAVIQKHEVGYIVVDIYRFERDRYVPQTIARYIDEHLQRVWEDPYKTVRIYRWQRTPSDK